MRLIAFLLILLGFASCDNELNVIEEPKDIPIVYGFLSISDTAQYIRLEKAFVDPMTSALELAQRPDSLYYGESTIVEIQDNDSGDIYTLRRIDGNNEGLVRDEGVFAQSPNYLYKILTSQMSLDPAHEYTLRINRGESFSLVTATTTLVGNSNFITPNPQNTSARLDFTENNTTTLTWGSGRNAVLYDVYVGINYVERPIGGTFEDKSLLWKLASNINDTRYKQEGRQFYTFMRENIEALDDVERRFISFDLLVEGANNQLQDYIRVGQANLGITSTQDIPTYSNLSEGRGIFASKFTSRLDGIRISPNTIDSLANGVITKDLNFRI